MIKIIPSDASISINEINYPKNSISFGVKRNNVEIYTINGELITVEPFDGFIDENNQAYSNIDDVITDLKQSFSNVSLDIGDIIVNTQDIEDKLDVVIENTDQALRVDSVGGGVTYIGYASAGTINSASTWGIQRITEVGEDVTIEWADGNKNKDNIWDDRISLTYS